MIRAFPSRRFLILMTPLVASVSVLLFLVMLSLEILSTARAYVGGEGYWSKAQKDAVLHLMRYARSREPADFEAYRRALDVPAGDRLAREALDRPVPDYAAARRGFIAGRNDPDDVDAMANFFVRYRGVSYVARAIAIWTEGDREITLLRGAAGRLHGAVASGTPEPARTERLLTEIRESDLRLAPLEDSFSQTLGEAARTLRDLLAALLVCAALVIIGSAALVVHRMLRRMDATERALREATVGLARHVKQLQFVAHHDGLTGLPNRGMLAQQAGQIPSRTRRHGGCAALLFIDLDGFKEVNDRLGHSVGDELLCALAARLAKNVRREDAAARLGGDEFCVVLDAMSDPESATAAAQHLRDILNRPYLIGNREVKVTASVGIACFPRDGEDIDALLKTADASMYRAKHRLRSAGSGP